MKISRRKRRKERNLLQKACDGIGSVSGLKEIMSNIKQDDLWRITRPPFCGLGQEKRENILKVVDHL